MGNLLKFEFRKLRKHKSFYICTAIMVALLLMTALLLNFIKGIASDLPEEPSEDGVNISVSVDEGASKFVTLDFVVGALSNASFVTIVGIFAVLFLCNDYEQQTIKNIFARGYSRQTVCLSKLVALFVGATVMFAAVEVAAFVIGGIYFGFDGMDGSKLPAVLGVQYLTAMANVSFAFAIASAIRKNGGAIAAVIVAPSVIELVLNLADSYLKLEDFSLIDLWLSSFLSDLSDVAVSTERMATCAVASVAYIALFATVGLAVHKKIEV